MRYILLAAALAALIGGYSFYWFRLAEATEQGIEDWRQAARADGVNLRHRGVSVGGYPFRLEVELEAPQLDIAGPDGTVTLSADAVQAVALAWRPGHVIARSEGPLRIDWRLPSAPDAPVASATASEAEASLRVVEPGELARAALDLHGISGEAPAGAFSAARAQLHLRRPPPEPEGVPPATDGGPPAPDRGTVPVYQAALQLDLVRLPEAAVPPELGPEIESLDIDATLRGEGLTRRWPPGGFPAALAAWRDTGGVVDITDLKLAWGPVTLASEGSITVDEQMRPLGAFTVRLGGYEQLVDAIAEQRMVDRRQMALVKMLLGGLSQSDAQGRRTVQVPVNAQAGRLYLGPIAVLDLPPLLAGP